MLMKIYRKKEAAIQFKLELAGTPDLDMAKKSLAQTSVKKSVPKAPQKSVPKAPQ
jgi:hypothetical protein